MAVTWDIANSVNFTLTNGSKTATSTVDQANVRATAGIAAAAKVVFGIRLNNIGNYSSIGVVSSAYDATDPVAFIGSAADGTGVEQWLGQVRYNGGEPHSGTDVGQNSVNNGDIVWIAVFNDTTPQFYFAIERSGIVGQWNGTYNESPAGLSSSYSYSLGGGTLYPAFGHNGVGTFGYQADLLATASDVTVTLPSGYSVLDPGGTSVALTGFSATGSRGTLTPAVSVALTGFAATGSRGTLTPVTGTSVALTGFGATGSRGTLTPSLSTALTGTSATGSRGTLTATISIALTGRSATTSQGAIIPATSVALTGTNATGSRGTLTPVTGISIGLTGFSATAARGSFTPNLSIGLTGAAATSASGAISPPATAGGALIGFAMTASIGTLTPITPALWTPTPIGYAYTQIGN